METARLATSLDPHIGAAAPDDKGVVHVATPASEKARQDKLYYGKWDTNHKVLGPHAKWDDNVSGASLDVATFGDNVIISLRDSKGVAPAPQEQQLAAGEPGPGAGALHPSGRGPKRHDPPGLGQDRQDEQDRRAVLPVSQMMGRALSAPPVEVH